MAADISALGSSLAGWETLGYGATAVVILGCVGEGIVEFTTLIKPEKWKPIVGRTGALVLLAGLAFEILAQVQVNTISGRMIAFLNNEAGDAQHKAGDAYRKAGELGVTVGNLGIFVSSEREKSNAIISAQNGQAARFEQELSKATNAIDAAKANLRQMLVQLNGVTRITKQVAADHSLKSRIRALMGSIDRDILSTVDTGQTDLVVRMEPADISTLQELIAEPGGASLISITGYEATFIDSVIANGTLGPASPVHEQRQVDLHIGSGLRN